MKLKLTIAYDGHPYSGWQKQTNGKTVQELIELALSAVAKKSITLHGSGRTDAGVHANGQVAHFEAPDSLTMNPFNWVPALNSKLPNSIRILHCEEAHSEFHARFDATQKCYSYAISLEPILHPHHANRYWHLPRQLDPASLEEALQHYVGSHSFHNFCALRGNETEDTDYTRTISQASLQKTDIGYLITYRGSGFLYKMVRLLTGEAVQVAQGRLRLDDHLSLLSEPRPTHLCPFCAPADGLTLESVDYP